MLIIFPNEICVCGGGGGGVRRKRRMAGIGVEVGGCGVCSTQAPQLLESLRVFISRENARVLSSQPLDRLFI